MSSFQIRTLAVCCWLITLCFAIAGAVALESYVGFRGGERAQIKIKKVEPHGDQTRIAFRYVDDVLAPEASIYLDGGSRGLQPGAVTDVLLHKNTGERILASDLSKQLPSLFVILGFFGSIALGVVLWRLPRRAAARRAARTSRLDALVEAAARTRNMNIGIGIFLLLCGAGFASVPFFDTETNTGGTIFLLLLGALTAGIGVLGLARAVRLRDPQQNEIIDLIQRRPQDIAWFYVREHTTEGIQATATLAIDVWKADGTCVSIFMVEEDLAPVVEEIAQRAPHARRGYDAEIERLYRQQPARWRPISG